MSSEDTPQFIKVSKEDRQRLEPHLTNWNKLNELFVLGQLDADDLCRLVQIEIETKGRRRIIQRLLARYFSTLRKNTFEKLEPWLEKSKSKRESDVGASVTDTSTTNSRPRPSGASLTALQSLLADASDSLSSKQKTESRTTNRSLRSSD